MRPLRRLLLFGALITTASGCRDQLTEPLRPDVPVMMATWIPEGPQAVDPSPGEAFYLDVDGTEYAHRSPGTFPGLMNAQQMTWTFWIRTAGVSGKIGGVHGVGDPNRVWWFEADDSGRELMIVIFNPSAGVSGTGEPVYRVTTGAPFNQQWQFVIVQFDGTRANPEDRLLVWVNSALADLVVPDGFPAYPLPSSIAGSANAPFEWGRLSNNAPSFVGQLGEIAIVRRLLSDPERDAWFYGGIRFDASQVAAGYSWRRNLDDRSQNAYDLDELNVGADDFGYTSQYPTIEFDWCVINPSPDCSQAPYPPTYSESCIEVPQCGIERVNGQDRCVCQIDGIDVNVTRPPGGTPWTPPPPPAKPDPPGWTWPDPDAWGGGAPSTGQPGECTSVTSESCTRWLAKLSCPNGVIRGEYGQCVFSIEPEGTPYTITAWTFRSDLTTNVRLSAASTWGGTLVSSGTVQVDFTALGTPGQVVANLIVAPRTSGIWASGHWASQMSYVQGRALQSCRASARPSSGARIGWTGSLKSAEDGGCGGQDVDRLSSAGFSMSEGSGPNEAHFFVSDADYYVRSTSQLHDGMFPSAATHPLVDPAQQSLCRSALSLPPGSPVLVNFHTFNGSCKSVPQWATFLSKAWDHEYGHFLMARDTLLATPDNDPYHKLEGVLGQSSDEASQKADLAYLRVREALFALRAQDRHPTGNWTTNFWIWQDDVNNVFWEVVSPNFNTLTRLRIR